MQLDNLFEATGAVLFHSTNFYSAVHIVQDNIFRDKTEHKLPIKADEIVKGVSCTRSRWFAMGWGAVAFELNRDLLAQKYRIIPINFWSRGNERSQSNARSEAEEFVVGAIVDADRYIVAVHMAATEFHNLQRLTGPKKGFYEPIAKHPLLKIHS